MTAMAPAPKTWHQRTLRNCQLSLLCLDHTAWSPGVTQTLGSEDISLKAWQPRPHLQLLFWERIASLLTFNFSLVREWAGQIGTQEKWKEPSQAPCTIWERLGMESLEDSGLPWAELAQKDLTLGVCAQS